MPPLLGLVFLGAGLAVGYRALQLATEMMRSQADRNNAGERTANDAEGSETLIKDLGVLEFDPSSGVYRPKN